MKQLYKLLNSRIVKLGNILKVRNNFNFPAVYVISKPDSQIVIYAGRTKSLPLWRRIYDHKTITGTTSDLNMMIKKKDYSQKIEEYGVRYLKIEDTRERMFFESFIIAVLQPELNKN